MLWVSVWIGSLFPLSFFFLPYRFRASLLLSMNDLPLSFLPFLIYFGLRVEKRSPRGVGVQVQFGFTLSWIVLGVLSFFLGVLTHWHLYFLFSFFWYMHPGSNPRSMFLYYFGIIAVFYPYMRLFDGLDDIQWLHLYGVLFIISSGLYPFDSTFVGLYLLPTSPPTTTLASPPVVPKAHSLCVEPLLSHSLGCQIHSLSYSLGWNKIARKYIDRRVMWIWPPMFNFE